MLSQSLATMLENSDGPDSYCAAAVQKIEQNLQEGKLAIYDQRITSAGYPIYGRYELRELLPDFDHIYVWSGAGKLEGDNFNPARTLAHEAFHAPYHGVWTHSEIAHQARVCGGEIQD
jgi:hypothetical protein